MTPSDREPQKFQFDRLLTGALLSLLAACSAEPIDYGLAADDSEQAPSVEGAGPQGAGAGPELPALTCGKAGELSAEGYRLFNDEVYRPTALLNDLASSEELRNRFSSDSVETCAEARELTSIQLELLEREEDEATSAEGRQPLRDDAVSGDAIGTARQPLWRGINQNIESVVMVSTTGGNCTGVFITPYHILTAGHCLPPNDQSFCDAVGVGCSDGQVTIRKATGFGTYANSGPHNARMYVNWAFSGGIDPVDDIGLIEVAPSFEQPLTGVANMWTPVASPGNHRWIVAAWGSTSQYSSNGGVQKAPPGDGRFTVDGGGPAAGYYYDMNDDDVHMCSGDSGAPTWINDNDIDALHTSGQTASGRICTIDDGDRQRFTPIGTKMGWIEQRLRLTPFWDCPQSSGNCCIRLNPSLVQCWS